MLQMTEEEYWQIMAEEYLADDAYLIDVYQNENIPHEIWLSDEEMMADLNPIPARAVDRPREEGRNERRGEGRRHQNENRRDRVERVRPTGRRERHVLNAEIINLLYAGLQQNIEMSRSNAHLLLNILRHLQNNA